MGSNSSRLDRLPAVALCRDRCKFIDEALRQSYALADAHVAHMESLRSLGPALLYFFDQFEDSGETETQTNAATLLSKSPPPRSAASSSDSDEHVVLHSESESENAEKESQLFTHYSHSRCYDYLHRNAVLSPASDNVTFMNYVQPIYDSYTPPPSNIGGFFRTKPPSPPPPPSNSAWDFLNFFEPYEKYQIEYSHGASGYAEAESTVEKEEGNVIKGDETGKSDGVGNGKASEVENGEAKNKETESSVTEKNPPATEECAAKRFCEAVKEIQILFEKASDSGNPILELLDVGKFRYHRKFDFNPVSCKMMHVFTPSNSLGVNCMESTSLLRSANYQGVDIEKGINYANICSTLSKLCQWEKKLYREVKAEEKLRILHQKKCKQLRRMKIKDEDAHKIDSVQTFIGISATKMKISIQVVDKISNTIGKLMEEELWPQINTFILMFFRMWKDMQECYKCKYQRLVETKTLDVSSLNRKENGNGNIDAPIKLKSELQKWNLSFSKWIHVQKCYVKALNGWLVRCLVYEPEEIPNDDSTPSSPTKVGAPPVFVISNKWSRTVDNISEKNVIEAVNGFMFRVNELLEKHVLELQQKLTLDKELERKVKMLEKQEQKMHKGMQAPERKMVPIARETRDDIVDTVSLQSGLKEIIFAMERFTATTASLYEELCQQVKQDNPV